MKKRITVQGKYRTVKGKILVNMDFPAKGIITGVDKYHEVNAYVESKFWKKISHILTDLALEIELEAIEKEMREYMQLMADSEQEKSIEEKLVEKGFK